MEKTRKIILFSCRKKGQERENEIGGRGGVEKYGGKEWERGGRESWTEGKMEGDRERKRKGGKVEGKKEGRRKRKERGRKDRKGNIDRREKEGEGK